MPLVTGDFANAFYDETGRDIEDGRLTWLIVNAYQRAKPSQKTALEENYGNSEAGKADIVRQVILLACIFIRINWKIIFLQLLTTYFFNYQSFISKSLDL